ncbi:synaptic vesicle 2-related protein-like isoform X2 [Convolutriloba macropyga]|uniref:synaptic vesicle 2-related protein-like isoform X2 n=1 Tax=Convolutriloba macropyga TaxID=536237 RepID=UPI003F52128B
MDLGLSTSHSTDEGDGIVTNAHLTEERIGIRTSSAVPAVLFVPDAAGGESEGDSLQFNLRGSLQIQNSIDSSGPNDVADSQQQASQPSERLSTEVQKPDDTAEFFTVDKAVDQLGFGPFQVFMSVLCGLAWIVDAMETMILSVLAPALVCEWRLTSFQEACVTVTVFTGMLLAAGFWGAVSDKYGRKFGLVVSSVITFYFGALTAFSPSYGWILILRGLTGVGIAGAPQAVTIYSEFLPSKFRARAIVLLEVFWAIGTMIAVAIALVVMPTIGWRYMVFFCALPVVIFIVLCYWLPESARYHVVAGDKEAALNSIKQIATWNKKPMPLGELIVDEQESSKDRGRFLDLFSSEYALTTSLIWLLWLIAAGTYYGIVLATTEIFSELSSSDEKCVTKAQEDDKTCWAECKELQTDDYVDILWTTLAEFPGLLIALALVEMFGRKKSIAIEFFLFGLFAFLVSFCMPRAWVTFLLFTSRSFVVAAFQTVYVYTCEIYPTTIRALGLGSGSGISRLGSMVTPFVAQVLLHSSIRAAMGVYFLVGSVAAVAALFLPLETKGRQMRST